MIYADPGIDLVNGGIEKGLELAKIIPLTITTNHQMRFEMIGIGKV